MKTDLVSKVQMCWLEMDIRDNRSHRHRDRACPARPLHHAERGYEFAYRGYPVQGMRIGRLAVPWSDRVDAAGAGLVPVDHLTISDRQHREARQPVLRFVGNGVDCAVETITAKLR